MSNEEARAAQQAEVRTASAVPEAVSDSAQAMGEAQAVSSTIGMMHAGAPVPPDAFANLQRRAGNAAMSAAMQDRSPVHDVIASPGQSLDPATRVQLEHVLGTDMTGVRLHTDFEAKASARSVDAQAYTVGDNIVLGDGVDLSTPAGQHTLVHEAVHTVQQRQGPVEGTEAPGGIRISDPSDRFEQQAEAVAHAFSQSQQRQQE